MRKLLVLVAGAAVLLASPTGWAASTKLCKLTGSYKDSDGLATATIKGKSGSLMAPPACSTPYSFKITDLTATGFTATGKNKTKSCGTFSASLSFEGSCSVFSGSVVIRGQTFSDTFTKQTNAARSPYASPSMTDGLN